MATNLKVGTRLAMGFGAVLILMVGLAGLGLYDMKKIEDTLHEIVNDNVYKMGLVQEMSESVHIVSRVTRTVMLLTDQAAMAEEVKKIDDARSRYDKAVEALEKTPASDKGKEIRARMREARLAARPLNQNVLSLARENRTDEALELLLKEAAPATQKWQETLDENIAFQKEINNRDAEAADEAYSQSLTIMLITLAIAVLIGGAAAFVITRSLLAQLGGEPDYAATIVSRIADGDLAVAIETKAHDQSSLLFAMKTMRDNLARIVGQVRVGTDTIATASGQITTGNQDLSSRTEQQASSLEETASSMEELTSTVKQNADNARQANGLAVSASEIAIKGGAVVSEVVDTMGSINDSAKKIVDIIGVIDGIAFQTNILALNAAVEAARAGEQGRGFAVVASEVRNLAQRSAAAAKEIKTLIGDSVEKVDAGSKLVDQAGATMEEIVESIKRVTDIMSEITAASQEQSAGIEQVNQAITEMDQVTQQNAALVEEATAAAESLQEQAGNLAQMVGVFQLATTHMSSGPGAQVRAAPQAKSRVAPIAAKSSATGIANRDAKMLQRVAHARSGTNDEWDEF